MEKKDKSLIESRKNQILDLISGFCTQKLDDEYLELSDKLLSKLGRKRDVPFMTGKVEIWAAAVVHALGTINFLFDKSFEPYATVDDINVFFGTNKSSTGQKSKIIRDLLNLGYFDREFSTIRISKDNPFDKLTMVNGFIMMKDPFQESPPKPLSKPLPKIPANKAKKINPDDSTLDLFADE
jgi:hypothetical protein